MSSRRNFLRISALGASFLLTQNSSISRSILSPPITLVERKPLVISTWNHGIPANKAAWEILSANGSALDAVEAGVRVVESDPESQSVGYGGLPDREGKVTLDACIMNELGECGAVAFLQNIKNPISVARKVMEDTPHVMLVGKGAQKFAISKGFKKENLLTPASKAAWKEWKKKEQYKTIVNRENHDTIGLLALDAHGNISGACTTSGMAYKLHGRVGDSPIIGAGLFVDNEIGGACATGVGEEVIRVCGSHLVVELMRQGRQPEEACKEAVERIIKKNKSVDNLQVGFIALNKAGEYGGYAIHDGFNFALRYDGTEEMVDVKGANPSNE